MVTLWPGPWSQLVLPVVACPNPGQVKHCAVDLCVAKQKLHGTKVACFAVYLDGFGPAERLSAVATRF